MPGQGGPVGHIGGVWQAQRLLYGRRAFAGVAERGLYFDFGCRGPGSRGRGFRRFDSCPCARQVDPVRRGPASRSRSGSGRLGRARPAHRRCMSTKATASPERVMAKPRVVSSSSARAGTRTATVLRSLSLPPGAGASSPRAHFAGVLAAPFGQVVAGVEQRGDDRVRKAAPDGP